MREQLTSAMKEAMKSGNQRRLSTLRLINAAISDMDISLRGKGKDPADDNDILDLLAKMVKQRDESTRLYKEGGRNELAAQEQEEIEIIREFMPEMLGEAEARQEIEKIVAETGAQSLRDMGKVMGQLKERFQGQIDMGKASTIIKEMLAG